MNRSQKLLSLFSLILLLLVGLLSSAFAQDAGLENLRETGKAFRSVAKQVSPAVVYIQIEKTLEQQDRGNPFGNNPQAEEFFRRFFGELPQQHPQNTPKRRSGAQGSGFIISPDGYIMTNNHVVANADQVSVTLLDGREYKAKIIGTDPPTDVAIIKIDETDLPYLRFADSDKLEVGDWVLAVGNPFGLSHTLTAGIVSAKGRSGMGLNEYENFIQTDAVYPAQSARPVRVPSVEYTLPITDIEEENFNPITVQVDYWARGAPKAAAIERRIRLITHRDTARVVGGCRMWTQYLDSRSHEYPAELGVVHRSLDVRLTPVRLKYQWA